MVSAENLTRDYGPLRAVDGVSFSVGPGRIAGFLGPNGAGKTTTLRMLLGLVRPTGGRALLFGRPYAEHPWPARRVGAAVEERAFVPGRSGRGHLRCYAPVAGASRGRVAEVLETVDLTGAAKRRVGGYSTGMRQRLALATALLGDPDLLVLDEPANGLDPDGILWLRRFLREFADSGRTVLLSSHLLGEMERIVDDVILVDGGRRVYSGSLQDLVHSGQCVAQPPPGPGGEAELDKMRAVLSGAGLSCTPLPDGRLWVGAAAQEVRTAAARDGLGADSWRLDPADLETAFLRLTRGRDGEEA
ncbi:ATP-binding cassette domain-containing protein [Streptomonospora sp. PA3]|nr:ATP-binding cassette domain-containing protein [Streptomonospora sp. PA3]